jgi:hypothetical protein
MTRTVNRYHQHCSNAATDINKILRWIIDHDPSVQRKLVLEKLGKTYSDIGKWLFENEVFTSWVDSTDGSSSQYGLKLLWMHGPGRNDIFGYNPLENSVLTF